MRKQYVVFNECDSFFSLRIPMILSSNVKLNSISNIKKNISNKKATFTKCITSFLNILNKMLEMLLVRKIVFMFCCCLQHAGIISQEHWIAVLRINSAWIILASSINCEDALLLCYCYTFLPYFFLNLFIITQIACSLRVYRKRGKIPKSWLKTLATFI